MDISGSYTLKAPRERVWECLLDPDMLQRTIPGCEKLEQTGPDEWRMRVNIGIAAVKGVYEGTLRMTDRVAPEQYRMVADGTGARSVLHGEGTLKLESPEPNTTVVNYQGQAQINGPLAGIANRVAPSVSKMLLKQFFGRFQQEMDATGASAPVAGDTPGAEGTSGTSNTSEMSEASDTSGGTTDAPEAAGDASTSASVADSAAPAASATEPRDESSIDASTSGVWEMSLPEARPLDGGQVLASALPLDPVLASGAASNTTAPSPASATLAPASAAVDSPAPIAAASGAASSGDGAGSSAPDSAAPITSETRVEAVSGDSLPSAATPAAAEDTIFDASTSGVWEMSLPEARPLDGEQTLATALPLDAAPAAPVTTASAAPASPAATASPANGATPPSAAAATPAITPSTDTPAPAMHAPAQPAAAATASATIPTTATNGPRASGSFMAWLMRVFGRAS